MSIPAAARPVPSGHDATTTGAAGDLAAAGAGAAFLALVAPLLGDPVTPASSGASLTDGGPAAAVAATGGGAGVPTFVAAAPAGPSAVPGNVAHATPHTLGGTVAALSPQTPTAAGGTARGPSSPSGGAPVVTKGPAMSNRNPADDARFAIKRVATTAADVSAARLLASARFAALANQGAAPPEDAADELAGEAPPVPTGAAAPVPTGAAAPVPTGPAAPVPTGEAIALPDGASTALLAGPAPGVPTGSGPGGSSAAPPAPSDPAPSDPASSDPAPRPVQANMDGPDTDGPDTTGGPASAGPPANALPNAPTAAGSTSGSASVDPGLPATLSPLQAAAVRQQAAQAITRLAGNGAGDQQLTLRLHPADLGQVDVSVRVRHGIVDVILASTHDGTRAALDAGSSDLRRLLTDAGLGAGQVDVRDLLDQTGGGGAHAGAHGHGEQRSPSTDTPRRTSAAPARLVATSPQPTTRNDADGVDLRL
ncbi:MAG: flagellar hook-length control protein FliK [Nocardioidaceae bacterium]